MKILPNLVNLFRKICQIYVINIIFLIFEYEKKGNSQNKTNI